MDIISYECAYEVNDILAIPLLKVCQQYELDVYRSGPHIDMMYWDDNPDDPYDDTIVAPNWDNLRACLYSFNPSDFIASEFEAIESIDEYAYKLKEYIEWRKTND